MIVRLLFKNKKTPSKKEFLILNYLLLVNYDHIAARTTYHNVP